MTRESPCNQLFMVRFKTHCGITESQKGVHCLCPCGAPQNLIQEWIRFLSAITIPFSFSMVPVLGLFDKDTKGKRFDCPTWACQTRGRPAIQVVPKQWRAHPRSNKPTNKPQRKQTNIQTKANTQYIHKHTNKHDHNHNRPTQTHPHTSASVVFRAGVLNRIGGLHGGCLGRTLCPHTAIWLTPVAGRSWETDSAVGREMSIGGGGVRVLDSRVWGSNHHEKNGWVHIATIVFLRIVIIQIGSTFLLLGVGSFQKPPESQKDGIWFLKRTMVEKNGESTPRARKRKVQPLHWFP